MLPIYYINVAARTDRRDYMEAQLARLGLVGQRIEAVTPKDLSADDLDRYCNPQRPRFLRPTELSCTLSHVRAWRALLRSGAGQALIMEDDIEIADALPAFLAEAPGIAADLIRIETTGATTRVFPVLSTGASGIAIRQFRSTPMGSAGYVIRAAAARRLVDDESLRQRQMDLALYSPFAEPGRSISRVLTDPALCRQLNMTSQHNHAVARSDIAGTTSVHRYAQAQPIRHRLERMGKSLGAGLRNALDHLAQQQRGLTRKVIPFGAIEELPAADIAAE